MLNVLFCIFHPQIYGRQVFLDLTQNDDETPPPKLDTKKALKKGRENETRGKDQSPGK
jgi:hypothetical protein